MPSNVRAVWSSDLPADALSCPSPTVHAHAAESLLPYLSPDASVLDIGSGSGYLLAVFHHLVKPPPGQETKVSAEHEGSRVVGIEHIQPLVDQSTKNLQADGLADAMQRGQIDVVQADGRKGECWRRTSGLGCLVRASRTPR